MSPFGLPARGAARAGTCPGPAAGASAAAAAASSGSFVCSNCGRTELPRAGDWDPPICEECDAEINFAAVEEVELTHD
jgi:hypothetical protein